MGGRPSSSWVIWCFKELWRAESVLPRDWDMGYGIKAISLMISIFISAVLSNFLGVKDLVSCRIWAVFICHGFWIPKPECSKPEYNIWFNTSESGVQILNSLYIAWFGDNILWSDFTACCYGKLFGRMSFFGKSQILDGSTYHIDKGWRNWNTTFQILIIMCS